jgi:hypothetical protein
MATSAPHFQKNFKLTIEDGLPQATVEIIGIAHWLKCCPLCGSMHQVRDVVEDAPYTPLCQTHPVLFKAELIAWHKLHPDVVSYKSLHLVQKAA